MQKNKVVRLELPICKYPKLVIKLINNRFKYCKYDVDNGFCVIYIKVKKNIKKLRKLIKKL